MGNVIESLKKHANTRRNDTHIDHHSQSKHPECISLNEITTIDNTGQKSKTSSNTCSEFYIACRNNDINKVRKLLEYTTIDEIDRLEPNGSTALHAACYHGHRDIVELLLKAGADRSIFNKFNLLPFDEAQNGQIKELFYRVPNNNRLVSKTGAIDWELINNNVLETATEERHIIKSLYDNTSGVTPINKMFEKIQKNYINSGLSNFEGIDDIRRFFQKATEEEDPKWIIKAYTAESDFYKVLNQEIAGGASNYQNERRYIIALLSYHPKLDNLSYMGLCYRVMQVNYSDLKNYQTNCSLMTKSFLSSSIDQKIAELFLCQKESIKEQNKTPTRTKIDGSLIRTWVMCIYNIKHHRTALHIEDLSQYANEGEILIMPYTVFQVKRISEIKPSYLSKDQTITQIELDECHQYLRT